MVWKGNRLGSSYSCQILAHKVQVWMRLICCCLVTQSYPTLCDPWTAVHQAFLFFTVSGGLLRLMSTESVMPSNHLILSHPLLFLPSIFSSIMVFSNESAAHIRWPKYWSFSFSISPSSEYSGSVSGNQNHHKLVFLTSGHTENKSAVILSSNCCYLWSRMAEAWRLSERWFLSKVIFIILKLSSSKS